MSESISLPPPTESRATIAGLRPRLPWPLSRWPWWNEPVRAERLAVLRIVLALVLLLDVLFTYLPQCHDFFGRDSLGSPELFSHYFKPEWKWEAVREDLDAISVDLREGKPFERTLTLRWRWSLLKDVQDPRTIQLAVAAWAAATFFLMIGLGTRLNAVAVWALSTSIAYVNPNIDNAGDTIRGIALFYLMLCPCGAAWSVDAWLKRKLGLLRGPVLVHPWVVCLLFLQMVFIYWCNGMYKLSGADWRSGNSLYYVLGDLTLSRWSYAQVPVPYPLTRVLTWSVLVWEAAFPLLVWLGHLVWILRWLFRIPPQRVELLLKIGRAVRILALGFGFAFHIGIGLSMELGGFVPYMLCLYLPLLPWERLSRVK